MSDINSPNSHRKAMAALGRDIKRHESELVELRALQLNLIRVYERCKASELHAILHDEIKLLKGDLCG
jgi:hypothetical protein